MSSTVASLLGSRPVGVLLIPHCVLQAPLVSTEVALATTEAVKAPICPRCHQPVSLPEWVQDGDLTECRGLLLRVSEDQPGYRIEQL